MKKIYAIIILLMTLVIVSPANAINFWGFNVLTGGGTGSLDKIVPVNNDMAIGRVSGQLYSYTYTSTCAGVVNGSTIIAPVSLIGCWTGGVVIGGIGGGIGGSGAQYYLAYWTGSSDLGMLASLGTAGQVLTSAGAGAIPLWANPVTTSGTPTIHQWPAFTTSLDLKGISITASKPVCSNSSGEPTVCAGTEGVWQVAGSYLTTANIAASISDSDTTHCPDGNSVVAS
jgi:hypothetical protein